LCTIFLVVLTGAVLTRSNSISADLTTQFHPAAAKYVPGEVIVKFKPKSHRANSLGNSGVPGAFRPRQPESARLGASKIGAGQSVGQALTAYQNDPSVEYVQPNYIYHLAAVPNDTQYGQLWAFKNTGQVISNGTYPPNSGTPGADMNIEKAGTISPTAAVSWWRLWIPASTTTRRTSRHMWNGGSTYPNHGYNYVNNNNDPMDLTGHGHTSRASSGPRATTPREPQGSAGRQVSWAVRVGDTSGPTTANIIQGINFAVTHGAR